MAKKQTAAERGAALQALKAALKSGGLSNFYVFYGEESFLKERYWQMLEKKVLDGPAAEFNFHRFNADSFSPQALNDAVDAMPMMAERTLIRVDDVDLFKQPEGAREQYRAILADLPDYCCLVFTYDTVEFKPDKRMKKLWDVISSRGVLVDFRRQQGRELVNWVRRHFLRQHKDIDDKLCQYLIFVAGSSMTALASEIEKLCAYTEAPQITRGDIDAVVEPVLDAVVFDITDAISAGEYDKALRTLQTLMQLRRSRSPSSGPSGHRCAACAVPSCSSPPDRGGRAS